MNSPTRAPQEYQGFEQGPIRPPSEAHSLLIRVTRNCPWNRCRFCPVYKTARFSMRPVEHVKRDIDAVHRYVTLLLESVDESGLVRRAAIEEAAARDPELDSPALSAAMHWAAGGLGSVFLQDANSLVVKPADLIAILTHLRARFPGVRRVTSYARSHTVARIEDEDLRAIRAAGLNRIHIGLESGADQVLALVEKGVTSELHVAAGLKVKRAGIELSEYVMPGLGGRRLSRVHALETAAAMNRIDPDFIRLRTLAIPCGVGLHEDLQAGRFKRLTDVEVAREILLFLEALDGISSVIRSDHVLNLFEDVAGRLPEDRERMLGTIRAFLDLPVEQQVLYQVGRRLGHFRGLSDLDRPDRRARAEQVCERLGIGPDNVDEITTEMMTRFV